MCLGYKINRNPPDTQKKGETFPDIGVNQEGSLFNSWQKALKEFPLSRISTSILNRSADNQGFFFSTMALHFSVLEPSTWLIRLK
jgi:hypothetical protein